MSLSAAYDPCRRHTNNQYSILADAGIDKGDWVEKDGEDRPIINILSIEVLTLSQAKGRQKYYGLTGVPVISSNSMRKRLTD